MVNRKKLKGRARKDSKAATATSTSSSGNQHPTKHQEDEILQVADFLIAAATKGIRTTQDAMAIFVNLKKTVEKYHAYQWPGDEGHETKAYNFCWYGSILFDGALEWEHDRFPLENTQDTTAGLKWLETAASLGSQQAMHRLLRAYEGEHGMPANNARHEHWVCKLARAGNPEGMVQMAHMYMAQWSSFKVDLDMSNQWLKKAADTGLPAATNLYQLLGVKLMHAIMEQGSMAHIMEYVGIVFPLDRPNKWTNSIAAIKLVDLIERVVRFRPGPWPRDTNGNWRKDFYCRYGHLQLTARIMAGDFPGRPQGFPDAARGIDFLQQGVKLGSADAASVLHQAYDGLVPRVVDVDKAKSKYWLNKAMELGGDQFAMKFAKTFEDGVRVPINPKRAEKLTKKAAKLGNEEARVKLNKCHACDKVDPTGSEFKRCSRCKVALYCSADCQRNHWKDGHKEDCKSLQALKSVDNQQEKPKVCVHVMTDEQRKKYKGENMVILSDDEYQASK